jgi:parallel beta-helix repeat protein
MLNIDNLKHFLYLLIPALVVNVNISNGRIIYVDNSIDHSECKNYEVLSRRCSDGQQHCFNSIQAALDFEEYGDTILIREGFYPEKLLIESKDPGEGIITISNYKNESVSIDGNNPSIGPLITIESDHVRINGLKISHSNSFGIISRDTDSIIITNCEVSYSSDGGIVFVDASDIIVRDCKVHHNNYRGLEAAHEAISMHNVHGFEVARCEVFDNREEGIDGKYGSKEGRIHHNRVYRNNGPNIYIDKANQIDVYNNEIYDAVSKAGISLNIESRWHTEGLAWTLQQVQIYNNIIYNNQGGIGFWLEDSGGPELQSKWDDIHIYNNTIINNAREGSERGGGIYIINLNPWNIGENISICNNIFSGNINEISKTLWNRSVNGLFAKISIEYNLFITSEESDTFGRNPVIVNEVGFIDTRFFDFRLSQDSQAIDAGTTIEYPITDFNGVSRPAGKGPDIGAFEFRK